MPTKRPSGRWMAQWIDHRGKRRSQGGFVRKREAEQFEAEQELIARRIRAGLITPAQVNRQRQTLRDLSSLIEDFIAVLETRRRSANHVRNTRGNLTNVKTALGWSSPADIDADVLEHHLREKSARTANAYRASWVAFCRWLTPKVLSENPIQFRSRNTEADRAFYRGPIIDAMVDRLIEAALDAAFGSAESANTISATRRA